MNLLNYLEIYISKADFNSRMPEVPTNTKPKASGPIAWIIEYLAEQKGLQLQTYKNYLKKYIADASKNKFNKLANQRIVMANNGLYYSANMSSLTHSHLSELMVINGVIPADINTFDYRDFYRWYVDGNKDFMCLITLKQYPGYAFLSESYVSNVVTKIRRDFKNNADQVSKLKANLIPLKLKFIPAQVFNYDPSAPTPKELIQKYYGD